MWTTICDIILMVLYLPLTLLYLCSGMLLEGPAAATISQWFEFRFFGYVGPILGLLTWPCLFAAIHLRKQGIVKAAAWLRIAPMLTFAAMILLCYLLRWVFG